MACRGIRGATTADANSKEAILSATSELLQALIEANGIAKDDVACVLFTTSPDLNAEFPAAAARQMGWEDVALLCGHEMGVPNSLRQAIRVLMLINTEKSQQLIKPIYLRGAAVLRPDLAARK